MKYTTIKLGLSILAVFALSTSCTKDDVNENEDIFSDSESAQTSGGSCSTNVKFDDLVVETSWISGNKDNRDTFGACGVDGESWMDKSSNGDFTLKCLAADGHRTELKEDSGDEAGLATYKRMKFTAKYSDVPSHGVTIAQIHNRGGVNRPWIRLYIDSDGKFKIKETETSPAGSSSTYSTYTGMTLNTSNTAQITIWTGLSGQNKAKIHVVHNGSTFQKTLWASGSWNNYANDYYLKAGVYTEGEDKQAKVVYSAFEIIH